MYCPDLVSTSISSPIFTKSGTLTIAPVSRVAGFDPPPAIIFHLQLVLQVNARQRAIKKHNRISQLFFYSEDRCTHTDPTLLTFNISKRSRVRLLQTQGKVTNNGFTVDLSLSWILPRWGGFIP
jgi:hypothetical protein